MRPAPPEGAPLLTAGPIELAQPLWLLLIVPLWVFIFWAARRSIAGLGARTRIAAIAVRLLVAAALVAALARPHLRKTSQDVATVVVLDTSASMPADMLDGVRAAIEQRAAASRRTGDRLGVVTVARDGFVESLADRRVSRVDAQHPGDRSATDLAAGVRLALATLPEDAAGRVLLVSDGNDTLGGLLAAAEVAAGAGAPIDVAPVRYQRDREVALDALIAPPIVRKGEPATLRFSLRATRAVEGRLTLAINDQPVDLDPDAPGVSALLSLQPGVNVQAIPIEFPAGGAQRLKAVFTPINPADDAISANNLAEAVTLVAGEGRALVLADSASGAEPVLDALRAAGVAVETRPPEGGFNSLVDLAGFDAVALIDTPAYAFTLAQQEQLRAFVHDLGGGLLVVGGERSFGAGGWIGSPLADAFPVKLDPPQKRQMPKGALAIVLDSSGSMGSSVAGVGTKQQAANEAAALAIESLSRLDLVTVIRFTGAHDVVVPLRERGEPGDIARRVRQIGPGGGTYIYGAMNAALDILKGADASVKHVILLTDGQSTGSPMQGVAIANEMAANRITLSTVAVGEGADRNLLAGLANVGGGQYYELTNDQQLRNLPQIFIKEAQTIRRTLIWEGEPVAPVRQPAPSEPLRGLGASFPPITGHIVTAEREGLALTPLKTPTGDPLLAHWQYGLGRVAAFTSDAGRRWASGWPAWPGDEAYWSQLVRWTMRPEAPANVRIDSREQGDETIVALEAFDAAGEPLDFARFSGLAIHPDLERSEFAIAQVGPGRYEGRFASSAPGAHLITIKYSVPGGEGQTQEGALRAAAIRKPAVEFRALRDNAALLAQVAQRTGGRVIDLFQAPGGDASPAAADQVGDSLFSRAGLAMPVARTPIWLPVALAALALFVIDVGVRRVRLDARAMLAAVKRFIFRGRAASARQVGALREARDRARRRAAVESTLRSEAEAIAPERAAAVARRKIEASATSPPEALEAVLAAATKPRSARSAIASGSKRSEQDMAGAVEQDEEVGLSRLLQAKRRARQSLQSEGDDARDDAQQAKEPKP